MMTGMFYSAEWASSPYGYSTSDHHELPPAECYRGDLCERSVGRAGFAVTTRTGSVCILPRRAHPLDTYRENRGSGGGVARNYVCRPSKRQFPQPPAVSAQP